MQRCTPPRSCVDGYVDENSPGDISQAVQWEAVRTLAEADGHAGDLAPYIDWGVSADIAKADKRTEYDRLIGDMEAGRVSTVYAIDVDRLYRDPRDPDPDYQDAAQTHRVRIVTKGGVLAIGDGDDPVAEGFAFMGAVFGRMELQKSKKRSRAAAAARVKRGDKFGRPTLGFLHVRDVGGPDPKKMIRVPDPARPADAVLDAYREAGTVLGAVKVPSDRPWRS